MDIGFFFKGEIFREPLVGRSLAVEILLACLRITSFDAERQTMRRADKGVVSLVALWSSLTCERC
ncbi:hypothetical protein [Burkholderia sp. TSV86]|uniref:hypothetical protein n=1 Tax=Burkholderia sp. TSV86 TaxID=1385594 RepID=UPI0007556532|nr:hypothetical protein [Burkholderia sp. TSV86]KVE35636.1 hypothetical protein WS68_06765 [Burkholderia sp. TSV86]